MEYVNMNKIQSSLVDYNKDVLGAGLAVSGLRYILVTIGGSFDIRFEDETLNSNNITTVKVSQNMNKQIIIRKLQVFSDFILPKQPTSVDDAMDVFQSISENSGNLANKHQYSSPLYAQLTPLKFVRFLKIPIFF